MKRIAPLTLLFSAALILTGCSGESDASNPEPSAEPSAEASTEESSPSESEFQTVLDELDNPLSKSDRLIIGLTGCNVIQRDAMGEDPDKLREEITREDLRLGEGKIAAMLIREDVESPESSKVTRAAVDYICPQVKDKMTEDAWKHGIFRDEHSSASTG